MSDTPRVAPYRRVPGAYPFSVEIQTRFGDLDFLGHVNNAAVPRLYEEARVRFSRSQIEPVLPRDRRQWASFVANVNISYLGEIRYPDPLTIAVGIARIGNSSYVSANAMFQNGACVGTCDCTLVLVSRQERRPIPIPEVIREQFERLRLREDAV